MERDAIPSAPVRARAERAIATPRARTTPYFPRDFCSSVLRAYFDPLAEQGLRRGVCYSKEARLVPFGGPVLRSVCGGVVRTEEEPITDTQRAYAISVPQSGYILCWHPTENACSLFNEDLEQPANHVFQTLDIFLPALAKSACTGSLRDGDLHFCIMLVVQVASVDSATGSATIYYGPEYVRDYGEPLEPARAGQPVNEDVVWSMLAEQGVTGEAAVEALLLRGAPLDDETTEVVSCLRRRLGVRAGITSASALATLHSTSPLPVVALDAKAPQQATTAIGSLTASPGGRRRAQGRSVDDAIVVSDADSEPGDSAENPLCLSSSPPTSPPDSDFALEVRHCCICPTPLELAVVLEECAATPPSSPPAAELAEAAEFAYWMDSLPGGQHGAGRLTLALDNRERDQVYQKSTRQNWRALQQAGVGYCTYCFAQCLSEHLGWTSSLVDPDGDLSIFTSAAVAWLYPQDPSLCTSFTAVCSRCQHSVLPATSLPAATPGCDVQLEHRILLLWCYRDHYLQGLAWRLWRIGRSWRRLLVVVLAANRLGLAWLESNAQRYAPGGPGQVQAGIQFATASSQLEFREEVAQPDIAVQRETQAIFVSVFMFVYASPLLSSTSARVALALRPTATPSTTLAAVPRQCICGAHGSRCINWTDPLGVGQRRFLCDQCLQPCGCLCGGCDVHDYTTDANSNAALCMEELFSLQGPSLLNTVDMLGDSHRVRFHVHDRSGALRPSRTRVDTAWIPSPPPSPVSPEPPKRLPTERRVGLLGGSGPLYSNGRPYRGGTPNLGPLSTRERRRLDDNYLEADDRSECWICLEPLHAHQLALCGHRRHANILLDCCMCNAHPGPDGEHDLDDDEVQRRRPDRQRGLLKVYRDLESDLRATPAGNAGRRLAGTLFSGASLAMVATEQIPSPPPSPPIDGFTSVVHYAPASPEAQAALHRHLSDGVPLLVSPPGAWSRRFLKGLSAKWVAFLENWDATNRAKVVPSGFPEDRYHGFGEEWLTYWRMHTSWFVAAVKESDVNMVEQWVATCDSRQAAAVGEVISALSKLLLPERHDPARSLQPFFAHALSPPVVADLHFDTYDNILWVILGRKRVWLLYRGSLPRCADLGTGRWNERLDIHPTSHPSLPWVYSELGPGAMLFIPCGFWHYVLSDPNTLATNQWFYPREVDHLLPPIVADGLQTLEALGTRKRRQTRWFSPSSSST